MLGPSARPVSTVFIGGGTPTLLDADVLPTVLQAVRDELGLAPDAEVTTEANPESTDREKLDRFVAAGINRVSLRDAERGAARAARSSIGATAPGGSRRPSATRAPPASSRSRSTSSTVRRARPTPTGRPASTRPLALQPDHVSAYALVVEEGTRLARQVRRGEVAPVDDDVLADRYELADERLSAAGYRWYEVSNWARQPTRSVGTTWATGAATDWWGLGPGAHSHVGGVRWWNVRRARSPTRPASPPARARRRRGRCWTPTTSALEDVLLRIRLAEGLPLAGLSAAARRTASRQAADGLLEPAALDAGRAVLTRRGRLLADAVVRDLTD